MYQFFQGMPLDAMGVIDILAHRIEPDPGCFDDLIQQEISAKGIELSPQQHIL